MNVSDRSTLLWKRLKLFLALMALVFSGTLAVVVANRLSDEALAVLAGVACGVGAALPTGLLIATVARRRDEARPSPSPQTAYPPVVVVAPSAGRQPPSAWDEPGALPTDRDTFDTGRHFTVVGNY